MVYFLWIKEVKPEAADDITKEDGTTPAPDQSLIDSNKGESPRIKLSEQRK